MSITKLFTIIAKAKTVCNLSLLIVYHYLCILAGDFYVWVLDAWYYPENYEEHWDEYITLKQELKSIFNQNP